MNVRPVYRVLAGAVACLGLFVLTYAAVHAVRIPLVVQGSMGLVTICFGFVAIFATSRPANPTTQGQKTFGFNDDLSGLLTERSWRTFFMYLGFFVICVLTLFGLNTLTH